LAWKAEKALGAETTPIPPDADANKKANKKAQKSVNEWKNEVKHMDDGTSTRLKIDSAFAAKHHIEQALINFYKLRLQKSAAIWKFAEQQSQNCVGYPRRPHVGRFASVRSSCLSAVKRSPGDSGEACDQHRDLDNGDADVRGSRNMSGGFLSKKSTLRRGFFARLSLVPHERNRHIFDEKLFPLVVECAHVRGAIRLHATGILGGSPTQKIAHMS
jgi:hypothetical protein